MNRRSRFSLMTAIILLMLIISAVVTVPAYADDGVPPAPDETPAQEESAPEVDSAPAEESSAPAVDSAPETVAEIIEQLPEGTDIVVLDEAGEEIPLASTEAADAIEVLDPRWCPTGATPGAVTCSPAYASLQLLVADVGSGFTPTTNGTIWIQSGSFVAAGDIVFDGATTAYTAPINAVWENWSNFSLTFQGGWSGGNNTTVNTATPSILNDQLSIVNWGGAITLKDITITPADPADTDTNYALDVQTNGNILLDRVNVLDGYNTNTGNMNGAMLDNGFGTGNVTINNSSFVNNEGTGLTVYSTGTVTTKNIVSSYNDDDGAYIDNSYIPLDKAVTMTGIQQFNNNGAVGLLIYSDGAITLANVVANDNGDDGVVADNTNSFGKLGVTIKGNNSFLNNNGDGLSIESFGAILLNNINASGNDDNGVYLDNCLGCALAKTVTLTGVNIFNDNLDIGLEVYSFGSIVVSNVTASNNYDGIYLDNHTSSALTFKDSIGSITIIGYGVFNDNTGDYGLYIDSYGSFTAANLTANNNNSEGAYIHYHKTGVVTGVNTFNGNGSYGLDFETNGGKVTISNVTANDNNYYGAYFDVTGNTIASVTLTGVNTFNDNVEDGLYIEAEGVVTISNVTANGNDSYGAYISNDYYPFLPANVTLSGTNTFNGNGYSGLEVYTYGAILINNLTANDNANSNSDGAYLDNYSNDSKTAQPVTITGFAHTNGNTGYGLHIETWGVVTLANMTANSNEYGGVFIDSSMNPLVQSGVTISGVNIFNDNDADNSYGSASGLIIYTYGAVLLSNITADGNIFYGVDIDNDDGILAMPVTINGYLHASNNNDGGMDLYSAGAILLTNITANDNGDEGVEIYNDYDETKPFNVTITGVNTFNDNGYNGLELASYGSIILSNITASGNMGDGLYLYNIEDNASSPITITGALNVSDNDGFGMQLYSNGAVLLGNITANGNGDNGVYIYNAYNPAKQMGVTIYGSNTFGGNDGDGLYIGSFGAILVNNITAYENDGNGAALYNIYSYAPKNITLTGVNFFMNNASDGLYFETHGMAILNRVTASGNNDGLDDDTAGDDDTNYSSGIVGTAKKSITLVCVSLSNNEGYGFDLISTDSIVIIKGLFSDNNLQGYTGDYGIPTSQNSYNGGPITVPCALP